MNSKEYVKAVLRTESNDFEAIKNRLTFDNTNHFTLRLLHAALGASTEANELLDVVKKAIFYGKDIDWINVREELGDMLWYIAIACDVAGISIEEVMEQNIAKLHARYSISFNEKGAINRDLTIERYVLEEKIKHSAIFCEHANEVPAKCPCDSDCYCKTRTCKMKEHSNRSHFIGCLKQIDISLPCTCEQLKDKEQKITEIKTEDSLTNAKDLPQNSNTELCNQSCELEKQIGKHFKSDHYAAARGEFKYGNQE